VEDQSTHIALRVERKAAGGLGASLDLMDIGVIGWPLRSIEERDGSVRAEFPSDRGLNVLEGQFAGDTLVGRWAMAGETDTAVVRLMRSLPPPAPAMEDVVFASGDVTLSGTIILPRSEEPAPGVVFVHGSGPQTRDADRFLAIFLASRGIASLVYDKRGTGSSSGDWQTSDFEDLAADAAAGVGALRKHPDVRADAVGLRGQSQGGWVAPLAAAGSPDVAFVITVAGPLVSPAEEGHWDAIFALQNADFAQSDIDAADRLLAHRDQAIRTGEWTDYVRRLERARTKPWFEASGISPEVNPEASIWTWYRRVMDFDPVPIFKSLDIPVLALYGQRDESIPAERSAMILHSIAAAGAKPYDVVVFSDANHSLRNAPSGDGAFRWPAYVQGFLETQVAWIFEQTD